MLSIIEQSRGCPKPNREWPSSWAIMEKYWTYAVVRQLLSLVCSRTRSVESSNVQSDKVEKYLSTVAETAQSPSIDAKPDAPLPGDISANIRLCLWLEF